MTDPAPVLRREVDALIRTQIATLKQAKPLTGLELADFRARSEKIRTLFKTLDVSQPSPAKPFRKRKLAYPDPSL